MFCPNCATQTTEDIKFCRKCGANLRGVQEALTGRPNQSIDWDKTWLKEMLLSNEERDKRRGITSETKRIREIKGGVIVASIGIGLMIFLYNLLWAVSTTLPPDKAVIVRNIWLCGLIPFLVGIAITFNGLVLSKRIINLKKEQPESLPTMEPISLPISETAPLPESDPYAAPGYSVTEPATYRLPHPPNRERQ